MSGDARRMAGARGVESPDEERSGVEAKAPEHDLSRAAARALLDGPGDAAAEEAAWAALAARLRAMGADPGS